MSKETIYSHPFSKSRDAWSESWVAPFSQSMTPFLPVSPASMNMMAPAAGAAAAIAAVSVGVAACAWGSMFGAMTGALGSGKSPVMPGLDPSMFVLTDSWDESEPETGALSEGSSTGARAQSAVRTVAADMESVVKDFEETGRKVAKAVSDEIESAVSTAAATPSAKPASIRAGATPKARKSEKQAAEKADTSTVKVKKPAAIEKPSAVDDLKKISGVGPKLEMVLNDLGVFTFGQIAAWTAAEIAWIDDYLSFSGRIERDKWIEQASSLAGKKTAANSG